MNVPKLLFILFLCLFVCGVFCSEYGEHYLEGGGFKECCKDFNIVDRENPQVYCYNGREKHPLRTFETVILNINIPPESYKLYEGSNPEDVWLEFESQRSLWHYNPFSWKRKDVRLDPFNQTCIGIVTSRNYRVELNVIRVDYWRVVQFSLGILLFLFGPRLSKNVFFYYVCGITLGVGASFLVLMYFVSRLFPKKPVMYGFFLGGSAITLYALQLLIDNVRTVASLYKDYVIGYFFSTSLISFIVCYRFGPVTDPRSINLIKWTLQAAALISIFMCSYFQEAVLGVDLLLLVTYNIPKSWFISVIAFM